MLLIIISLVLAAGVFIVLGKTVTIDGYRRHEEWKINKKQILAAVPLVLILLNFFTVVPANHVGIVYSPFSGIKEETISEGIKSKGIFDKVYKISTEVQTVNLESITGQTKDGQWVDIEIDIKYKVDSNTAFQVFKQFRTMDKVATSLIPPTVQRSIEEVSTQHNVIDILGEKRSELYKGIEIELKERLASNGISFVSINFTDMDAGQAIEDAIQREAIAKKEVETAEQSRLKSEVEAQKRVIEAQADKEAAVIKAEIRNIEAEAEAEVNRKMAESITPLVIQRMEAQARQKWGWVTVQGGDVITDTRTSD